MKKLITILLSVPLLLSAGIVSETADTISYQQSNGETVTVHKLPKRPVVLQLPDGNVVCGRGKGDRQTPCAEAPCPAGGGENSA